MSDNLALRMTIDVCVFAETKGETLAKVYLLRDGGPKEPARRQHHTFGVGEQVARKVMEAIKRGDIEIDDIRDIEDHT